MSRFNPQVGAVDTSNFTQTAALSQEGRNRSQDRQIDARELQSQILANTNRERLAARDQAIQLAALEQENVQALNQLAARMAEVRGNLVLGNQQLQTQRRGQDINQQIATNRDQTTRRGQDIDKEIAEGADQTTRRGQDIQQDIAADRIEAEQDIAESRNQTTLDATREQTRTQRYIAALEQAGATQRQGQQMVADFFLAQQNNVAAMERLDKQLRAQAKSDVRKFYGDAILLDIRHRNDMKLMEKQFQLEAENQEISPEDGQALQTLSANLKDQDAQKLSTALAVADNPRVRQEIQDLTDLRFVQMIEESGSRLNSEEFNEEEMQLMYEIASPELKSQFEKLTGTTEGDIKVAETVYNFGVALATFGDPEAFDNIVAEREILVNPEEMSSFLETQRKRVVGN